MLFDYFLAPRIPLETLLTNPALIRGITKTLYFNTFLTTFRLLESNPSLIKEIAKPVRKVLFVPFAFYSNSLSLR